MAAVIPPGEFYDTPFWAKIKDEDGNEKRVMVLPITKYGNIIGRPQVLRSVDDLIPTDMGILMTGLSEIPDNVFLELAGDAW